MALRSPSSTWRRNLGPPYSPPADSLTPTSQGGSSNGARADVARKTKQEVLLADHLLAKLEKEGVEIDGKITSIIGDGIGRIQADAAREHMNGPKWKRIRRLLAIASAALGFVVGVKYEMNREVAYFLSCPKELVQACGCTLFMPSVQRKREDEREKKGREEGERERKEEREAPRRTGEGRSRRRPASARSGVHRRFVAAQSTPGSKPTRTLVLWREAREAALCLFLAQQEEHVRFGGAADGGPRAAIAHALRNPLLPGTAGAGARMPRHFSCKEE
ncbi:hypothetical protein TRIUR3_32986 [Triticum urartu]|uniref:Uncharacterized protein n=1 Tax=Triticum urartu TaxID=4572 RepID=M7ZFH7_TRIUA|nr:hypothetical protein TRIUR3_32986 [Triticum urartu]